MSYLEEISKKCFKCKNAPCINDCPIHNNIPEILKLYSLKEYKKAYEFLFNNNPLFQLCGLLCPHESQCAKNCKYKKVKNERIEIELIEKDLLDRFGINYHFPPITKGKVIVIGSGPAGLMSSILLRQNGYEIVLCEAENKIGGVLSSQIPEFRFDSKVLDELYDQIKDYIDIRLNTKLGRDITLDDLKDYDYQLIAFGCNKPIVFLEKDNVLNGYDLLKTLKNKTYTIKNKKIGVLGCGNAAIDVARSLVRLNNDVTIIYRRTLENAPATIHEINEAKEDGVKFLELLALEDFENNNATLRVMELLPKVEGERHAFKKTDKVIQEEYDYMVETYGANPNYELFLNEKWFKLINDRSWLKNNGNGSLYFIGDAFNHPTSIVHAINDAKVVCEKILQNEREIERIKKDFIDLKVVFGGSFNPPTIAHVELYNYLKKHLTNQVIVLPNGNNYPAKELLPFDKRVELIKLCMQDVIIDDYENHQNFGGTVKYLETRNHPLFVIGSDSLFDLSGWIEAEKLIKENNFLVFKRADQDIEKIFINDLLLQKYRYHFYILNINISDVSSTDFRSTKDENIVTDEVYKLIIQNNFYN